MGSERGCSYVTGGQWLKRGWGGTKLRQKATTCFHQSRLALVWSCPGAAEEGTYEGGYMHSATHASIHRVQYGACMRAPFAPSSCMHRRNSQLRDSVNMPKTVAMGIKLLATLMRAPTNQNQAERRAHAFTIEPLRCWRRNIDGSNSGRVACSFPRRDQPMMLHAQPPICPRTRRNLYDPRGALDSPDHQGLSLRSSEFCGCIIHRLSLTA